MPIEPISRPRRVRSLWPASLALVVCYSASAQQAPAWHVSEQAGHGETTRTLSTESSSTYPSADGTLKRVTLELRCSGPLATSATLSADAGDTFAVKSEATVTLPLRLDGEPAVRIGWANLSLHKILLYDLRDLLPPHRQMSIDVPLGGGAPQMLTFDLSELASTMRASNCRRRLR